jgi:hypothetical protein
LIHHSLREHFIFLATEAIVQAGASRRSREHFNDSARQSRDLWFFVIQRQSGSNYSPAVPLSSEDECLVISIPLPSPRPHNRQPITDNQSQITVKSPASPV